MLKKSSLFRTLGALVLLLLRLRKLLSQSGGRASASFWAKGGARGRAAHRGVLEVLEKLHIPVDCVAGASMGALVAGAYAAGMSPGDAARVE